MKATREQSDVWICTDCMILHANGDMPTDPTPGEPEPLSRIGEGEQLTAGMVAERHECGWPGWSADRPECDCDTRTFDTGQCAGCGSWLAGERHAATIWRTSVA